MRPALLGALEKTKMWYKEYIYKLSVVSFGMLQKVADWKMKPH